MNGDGTSSLDPGDKAAVLAEALPYIRRFAGKVVVVKYGGNALAGIDPDAAAAGGASRHMTGAAEPVRTPGVTIGGTFAEDIVLMRSVGMKPVVVHGGGPQIGALMARLGVEARFVSGLRVTDAETLDIARMVLVGKVNRDIVGAINVHAPLAVGLSGEDAGLITAAQRSSDLGFVGDVDVVAPGILERLLGQGLIPVVATIGADATGQAYNINADTVAGAVAEALSADKLVYLTDVDGVRADAGDPGTLVRTATADELDALVVSGAVQGGMIPKAEACARAVRSKVGHAHILDGRVDHALLLEIFTQQGVGTMVTR
ncbi:MAG: acetylglutamate kinase [Actinomycetota bacterium]|nr:acetylglutamate kinase [Actinomycetota bacterium]